MFAKLGGDLPVSDLLTTTARDVPGMSAFPCGCLIDDIVSWQHFLAIWANNLVFHDVSFLSRLESSQTLPIISQAEVL
jgi:hypothetical protein